MDPPIFALESLTVSLEIYPSGKLRYPLNKSESILAWYIPSKWWIFQPAMFFSTGFFQKYTTGEYSTVTFSSLVEGHSLTTQPLKEGDVNSPSRKVDPVELSATVHIKNSWDVHSPSVKKNIPSFINCLNSLAEISEIQLTLSEVDVYPTNFTNR